MIRICFIVDAAYPGGAERYIALLAANLDRSLFVPSIVVRKGEHLEYWGEELRQCGIEVHAIEMNLPFTPTHIPSIINKLRTISPHIVHMNLPGPYDGQMGLLAPLARIAGTAKVVVTEHLPMVEKLWKRALLKRIAYSWVDLVITVCRANVPFLINRQAVPLGKIRVVHNALPLSYGVGKTNIRSRIRDGFQLKGNEVAICIIGSLIRRKGHTLLIEALGSLVELPWFLVVIGEGDKGDTCKKKLQEKGIAHRATFVGSVSRKAVEEILTGMDVLVMPSYMEAFPYAILEAMASSVPVVASKIFGIPEAVTDGENGLLVAPGNVDALEKSLSEIILSRELRERMGKEGRRRFEKQFALDKHIQQMQAIYENLLQ